MMSEPMGHEDRAETPSATAFSTDMLQHTCFVQQLRNRGDARADAGHASRRRVHHCLAEFLLQAVHAIDHRREHAGSHGPAAGDVAAIAMMHLRTGIDQQGQ